MNIRSSYDSFRELRENKAYYIDKTGMIKDYLVDKFDKAVLFARPRRFGKTLTMTMFRDFLDIRQDSKDIFDGLEIMNHSDVVNEFMNQYPVVFISLKEIFGTDIESINQAFSVAISKLCEDNKFLVEEDNNNISEVNRNTFRKLWAQEADQANTERAIDLICQMLRQYYGKPVFVIIDEYDVPMGKAMGTMAYDKVRDMIEHMLSYVCKTNENVKAVMLSGCLFTVKNSTYTGVNNIIPYTILSPNFASYIGFTDDDVRKILEDAGIEERYDTVKEWYDGYIFGRTKMYCPWDVLLYVRSILDGTYSEAMGPKSYWVNTSETSLSLIHSFLGKTEDVNEKFERLLAGDTINCTINDNIPYHRILESGENIWSALVETGYLSKTVTEEMPLMPLKIPNNSIRIAFRDEVWNYFKDKVDNSYVKNLVAALWDNDITSAESSLNQILESTLSFYHEYREYSYHLILDGFFTGIGYNVQSERETGYGRSDLIIQDPVRNRCIILELKHVKNESEMEGALQEAASQIIQKKYDSQLNYEGYKIILKYGISCHGKQCRIRLV
ncbi:AAA family ATPase [Pseudobutyrivibrio sp.]